MGPDPPAGGRVRDVFDHSPFHARFLSHTRETRDLPSARANLAAEWHYLEPLLAGRTRPRVLDLACGSGPYALAWAERGAVVVGADFDRDLLAVGRERVAAQGPVMPVEPAWIAADATALPFRDAAFDVVFCNSLLEHVPDWQRVLAETSRVLGPGGVAVVYTTNRHCPFQQEVNHFPFYPWLPDPVQRRVLAWIMTHRRELVNWTDFPAIHWFTFPRMRRAFAAVGLEPRDRLDLLASRGGSGARGRAAAVMGRHPVLKLPYYFYAISLAMYGVRRG